jgi:broad specificity phosphatase PhoE
MKISRYFLVRHGETIENASGIVQGQLPGRLSDEGLRQAYLVAGRLGGVGFDAVYASDLDRAYTTAKIIMEGRSGLSIVVDRRLREQGFGVHEGKPIVDMLSRMKSNGADFATFAPDGGEDPIGFYGRVAAFFDEARSAGHETVLIVTHYGVINALLRTLIYNVSGVSPDRTIGNSAITVLAIDEQGAAKIETVNDIDHLESR